MDIETLLNFIKQTYGVDAYTFKKDNIVGITIEGPEQQIKERLLPDIANLIKDQALKGIFKK